MSNVLSALQYIDVSALSYQEWINVGTGGAEMRYGIYRNSEGYSDPTAGAAMRNILRDERRKRRGASEKHKRQLQKTQQQKPTKVKKEVVPNDG